MRAENSTLTGTCPVPYRRRQLRSYLGGRLKNDIGNTNAHENRMRHTALPLWKIEHQISKIVSPRGHGLVQQHSCRRAAGFGLLLCIEIGNCLGILRIGSGHCLLLCRGVESLRCVAARKLSRA